MKDLIEKWLKKEAISIPIEIVEFHQPKVDTTSQALPPRHHDVGGIDPKKHQKWQQDVLHILGQ